jgi:general stress protein 26
MTKNLQNEEAFSKLKELVKEVEICMFATYDDSYNIFSRPMATIEVDEAGTIWFYTNEYSEKVQDISKDNTVYMFYSHPGKNTYVHIKGFCTIETDRALIKEKWNPVVKAWFPGGVDDPKLSLLKVEPKEASYWDGHSNKLVSLFKIIGSIGTGQKTDQGDQGSLKF